MNFYSSLNANKLYKNKLTKIFINKKNSLFKSNKFYLKFKLKYLKKYIIIIKKRKSKERKTLL